MRERDVEAYLVKAVRELGGECRKVKWIGRRGAPDRLVMLPGTLWSPGGLFAPILGLPARAVWVELKAPGVEPEDYQLREHERMRAMGQRVVVIDSIEGVKELLA